MMFRAAVSILVLALCGAGASPAAGLDVPLAVKETAGVGARAYPVSAIVPLPRGRFHDVATLRVLDDSGAPVPAQIEPLNRWWARGGSIRHVKLEFQPGVAPFRGAGTGIARYRLVEGGPGPAPAAPVRVIEDDRGVSLGTGSLTIVVERRPFRIMTSTGPLEAVLETDSDAQRSFERSDVSIEVEERGPMRAVIRVEAPTIYAGPTRHVHGWAIRIYAWAGQPFVRVDYQLQNSSKTKVYAAPLYFRSLRLSRPGGVPAHLRHASEMGGSVGQDAVHLIPPGGWVDGRYWLDDMRHVVFQTTFWFSGTPTPELTQWPPVVVVPTRWYAETRVTLDLGGIVPLADPVPGPDIRRPAPPDAAHTGWENFWLDVSRKTATSQAGGWAYSASRFIATESPADVFHAERFALGELNGRPQWMAQYRHSRDWPALRLSTNPYAGASWRRYDPGARGLTADKLDAPYQPGTARRASARDDQHGWFYHVEEAFYATGNPWIRDWYAFVGEFRQAFLENRDPFPDGSSRGIGHALNHALQAYRVTGNPEILPKVRRYVLETLRRSLLPTGARGSGHVSGDPRQPRFESVFMTGYLCRALVNYLEEVDEDADVEAILRGMIEWNVRHANFGYGVNPADPALSAASSGSGLTMADPQAWLALRTGSAEIREHLVRYMRSGINGGGRPYGELARWSGDFVGRVSAALAARHAAGGAGGRTGPSP